MFDGADVVRGNIEECPSIERQAIHALHFVCLGGDFHHQIPHAVIRGFAHHAESVHRLGRGQVGFCICVAVQAIVHRREQCGPAAGIGVEHGLHKIGGGRLALGAGDTDDGQLILRAAIELSGQQAHGLTRIIDDQSRGAGDGGILGFGHVCGKSGLIDVRQVIRLEPTLAAQERAGNDLARVIGNGSERLVSVGKIRCIVGPAIALDDFAEQMMSVEQFGGRSQSQSHKSFSPYS